MYQELRSAWNELTAPGARFEVTEVDVRGVAIKTYVNAPSSLRDLWLLSADFADNDYLVYQEERWTYAQAHQQVAAIASWLKAHGVQPGDRVAIAMRNYPEWLLGYWAVASMGAVVVGLNAWWIGPEMVYGLNDSAPKVLICDEERLTRALEHRDEFPDMIFIGVRLPEAIEGVVSWSELTANPGTLPDVSIDPDSDVCIFYTSGTTGSPKGAQLTHRGCVANVMNLAFWAATLGLVAERAGKTGGDPEAAAPTMAALVTTPLFHVTANNCVAHGATLSGGKLVHMYRWDAGEALRLIEAERITNLTGVPVMAREVISHPDFATTDTSSLTGLGGGGAQLQPDLVSKIDSAVETARPNTGYGMTETCGVITSISADYFIDKPESAGPALPVYDVKLVDDDGNEVPRGEPGELWVKGAPVIRGYINRPDDTAEAITDGWLHTGDIARIDEDNFIFIVDRKKDMVIRGGENIYCAEVENTIHENGEVAECVVFGVPDQRLGEEVGAAVFLNKGGSLTADELRNFCAERISRHKLPRYIWFTTEPLPRNANGKFMKRDLKVQLDPAKAG
ncbi:MAG: class I adenylate-forming enzyme family protein [Gammaproteobacteria bacterium]|nr:class I adenylate-forming enzyme family protein [Gammaproteobacteria bacterium]